MEEYNYAHIFIEDEEVEVIGAQSTVDGPECFYHLSREPILPGTLTGSVKSKRLVRGESNNRMICTFVDDGIDDVNGRLVFEYYNNDDLFVNVKPINGTINYDIGEFKLTWDTFFNVPHNVVKVSYEVSRDESEKSTTTTSGHKIELMDEAEAIYRLKRWAPYPDVTIDFTSHDDVMTAIEKCPNQETFSLVEAVGDTFMEKYESLYVKFSNLTDASIKNGAQGYFCMTMKPEMADFIDATQRGFCVSTENHLMMGANAIQERGIVSRKWKIFCDESMPKNKFILGPQNGSIAHCSVITCDDWII